MGLPGFTAEAAAYRTERLYQSRGLRARTSSSIVAQYYQIAPSFSESCGLAWLLCTLWADPWSCAIYRLFCEPPPCQPKCDPCVYDPTAPPPFNGTMQCVNSRCQPYTAFCQTCVCGTCTNHVQSCVCPDGTTNQQPC
jgi:hypothetical protein